MGASPPTPIPISRQLEAQFFFQLFWILVEVSSSYQLPHLLTLCLSPLFLLCLPGTFCLLGIGYFLLLKSQPWLLYFIYSSLGFFVTLSWRIITYKCAASLIHLKWGRPVYQVLLRWKTVCDKNKDKAMWHFIFKHLHKKELQSLLERFSFLYSYLFFMVRGAQIYVLARVCPKNPLDFIRLKPRLDFSFMCPVLTV